MSEKEKEGFFLEKFRSLTVTPIMDSNHQLEFDQIEQVHNSGTCVMDSDNFKGLILDSKDDVNGNGAEINQGLNLLGTRKEHENVSLFGNETNQGDCLDNEKANSSVKNLGNDKDVVIDHVVELPEFVADEMANIFGPSDDVLESEEKCNDNGSEEKDIAVVETVDGHGHDEEDKSFVSGDIVWAMMKKTKLWWPGIVHDPSSKPTKKFISKDCFFVKLFSNSTSLWASSSELKEFTRFFDEMVKQNGSRSLYIAVEKALKEIGYHVTKELTCSCIENPCPPKILELKAFRLSQFQPVEFLSFIKHLAIDSSVSQNVQVTVTRNCLSTFYQSLGHKQMEIHQLGMNRNPTRKSSRNVINLETNQTEDCKDSKKESARKCIFGSSAVDIAKIMNSSVEKIFYDLRKVAIDVSISRERRYSCSLKNFFSCFKQYAYIKPDVEEQKEGNKLKKIRQRKTDIHQDKYSSLSVNEGPQVGFDATKDKKNTVRKRRKENVVSVISEGNTANEIFDLYANIAAASGFPDIGNAMSPDFQISGQHAMSSVGGNAMSSFGGNAMSSGSQITGQHAMSSVVGLGMPSVEGNAMSSVGGHAMSSVGGHFLSSLGGFQITGHAVPSVEGHTVPSVGGHVMSMSSVVGLSMPSVGGHSLSAVGGHAMPFAGGHAMPFAGGDAMPSLGGDAMSSLGGDAMSSLGGHAMSSLGGFQITGHEDEVNMTKMESEFINHGIGWLDSNGNSMSFVQLLKGLQGDNILVQDNFASPLLPSQSEANPINFGSQQSFSSLFQTNQINFGPIDDTPEHKKMKQNSMEKPSNPSPQPDLTESNMLHTSSNQHTDKPPKKKTKNSPDVAVNSTTGEQDCVQATSMKGFKPVTLLPGFGPPRATPLSDLMFIKQKLEMMKSTMEKAGNSLSPEMRGKLENEIHGFSLKINSMLGSPVS